MSREEGKKKKPENKLPTLKIRFFDSRREFTNTYLVIYEINGLFPFQSKKRRRTVFWCVTGPKNAEMVTRSSTYNLTT